MGSRTLLRKRGRENKKRQLLTVGRRELKRTLHRVAREISGGRGFWIHQEPKLPKYGRRSQKGLRERGEG